VGRTAAPSEPDGMNFQASRDADTTQSGYPRGPLPALAAREASSLRVPRGDQWIGK
jgi:hypothetical protein